MSADVRRPGEIAGALLWALLGAAACGAMIPLEPNLLEEGALLHFAQRMNAGERLYVDVLSFTGPLPSVALAWLFRAFGEELLVARAAVAVLHGVATAAIYVLAARARVGALAHAAAACVASAPVLLFPLFSLYFYATIACQLAIVAAALAAVAASSIGLAAAAGVAVAAVALTKQTLGIALALALGLALAVAGRGASARAAPPTHPVREREDPARLAALAAFAAGGAGIAILVVGYYAARGELTAVWNALVTLPLSFSTTYDSPLPNLWPLGRLRSELAFQRYYYLPHAWLMLRTPGGSETAVVALAQLLYALPFVALAATAVVRLLGPLRREVIVHAGLLAALATNLFPRADWGHLVVVLPTTLVQLLLLAGARTRRAGALSSRADRTRTAVAGLVVCVLLAASAGVAAGLYARAAEPAWGPRIPLREINGASADHGVPKVIRYLRERVAPGEAIFVPRAEPLIYFATDTRNPTPYPGILPALRDEQQRTIRAALGEVRYVVMNEHDSPIYTYYGSELPGVQQDLERYFKVAPEFLDGSPGWLLVYERSGDRGALHSDLVEAPVRRWLRDAEGREVPAGAQLPQLASRLDRRPLPLAVGPRGGGLDFELDVPEGARFQADVGLARAVSARGAIAHAGPLDMTVRIARSGETFEELARVRVAGGDTAPGRAPPSPSWTPLELDLARYAGQRVLLRLEAEPVAGSERPGIAWWGSPRIALPAESGSAADASRNEGGR